MKLQIILLVFLLSISVAVIEAENASDENNEREKLNMIIIKMNAMWMMGHLILGKWI